MTRSNAICGVAICGWTICGRSYTVLDDVKYILESLLFTSTNAICGLAICGWTICGKEDYDTDAINPNLIYLSRLPDVKTDCMALTLDGGVISKENTRLKTTRFTFMSRGRSLVKQRANVECAIQRFIESTPIDIEGCRYLDVLPTASGHFDHKDRTGPLYTESVTFEVTHT